MQGLRTWLSAAHPPSRCIPILPCPAAGSRKGLSQVRGGTESGSSRCRVSSGGSPSRTCGREKNPAVRIRGQLSTCTMLRRWEKHLKVAEPGLTHITDKCFAKLSQSSWKSHKIHIFRNLSCYAKDHELVNMQQSLHGWRKQQPGPLGTAGGRQGSWLQERGTMLSHTKKQKNSWSIFRAHFSEEIAN